MSPGTLPLQRARRLLVLDSSGAALTVAITLGFLATGIVESGVPMHAWWVLGGLAVGLCLQGLYDRCRHRDPTVALRRLAIANVVYAVLALGIVAAHHETVTALAAGYVFVEAAALIGLAAAEWREWNIAP